LDFYPDLAAERRDPKMNLEKKLASEKGIRGHSNGI